LECGAAALAALRRSDEDLTEIQKAYDEMDGLCRTLAKAQQEEKSMLRELIRIDIRFHMGIITASRNDLMKKEIMRLHLIEHVAAGLFPTAMLQSWPNRSTREKREARRQESLSSHRKILQSIVNKDATAARTAMHQHIQDVIDDSLLVMAHTQASSTSSEIDEADLEYLS
jgi:DNA-binding FadR family transcriptional regulator